MIGVSSATVTIYNAVRLAVCKRTAVTVRYRDDCNIPRVRYRHSKPCYAFHDVYSLPIKTCSSESPQHFAEILFCPA